ncbi:MAG TPA: hypothetical protein V6D11_02165 [Waterburya sp.]
MRRYELAQRFSTSNRRHPTLWHDSNQLGTLCCTGVLLIVTISSVNQASAAAALFHEGLLTPVASTTSIAFLGLERSQKQVQLQSLPLLSHPHRQRSPLVLVQTPTQSLPLSPTTLPPANFPIPQDGVVNVPPVNGSEAATPNASTPETPPATLPSSALPTDQTPAVRVPPLQPIPIETPTPITTSQPVEPPAKKVSPALGSSPVIEFGQPLPKAIVPTND